MKLTNLFIIIFFVLIKSNQPTIQAENISATYVSNTAISIEWTNGNGERRAVFAKEDGEGIAKPIIGTSYIANSKFKQGSQIDTSGWYCVYDGTGSSVTVTNLANETQYIFMVTEYNIEDNEKQYLTTTSVSNPAYFMTIDKELILFPNFISPNGDGKNDIWVIKGIDRLEYFNLKIYNNIGKIIYERDDYQNDWDATYNGKPLPDGTYYYIFEKEKIVYKGTITVIQ